jgi:hypothetical protein
VYDLPNWLFGLLTIATTEAFSNGLVMSSGRYTEAA